MLVSESSIPAALQKQAPQRPDAQAFTFIDYELDPAGYFESLTWCQVQQRVRIVAQEVVAWGLPGDRVAIWAFNSAEARRSNSTLRRSNVRSQRNRNRLYL